MVLVTAFLCVGVAQAQDLEDPAERDKTEAEPTTAPEGGLIGMLLGAQLEGGLSLYSGGMAGITEVGPAWGVRAKTDMGLLGAEISYRGSRNAVELEDIPGDEEGALWKNGFSTLAKVQARVLERVTPYVGVGVGGSFIHPTQEATPLLRDDFVFEIPMAAGVDFETKGLVAGLRGSWTPLVGLETADGGDLGEVNGGSFLTTLNIGGQF